jgi:copper(I)-binding protein
MKRGLIFATLFVVLSACSDQGISINDPWVREAPPNAKALAAYMVIENHSPQQKTLISVSSSAFKKVEIHRTVAGEEGTMRMVPQPQLIIAAKSQVVLKPGDYHLMLMGGQKPLKAGDKVVLTLKFAEGDEIRLDTPVRKSSEMAHNH